MFIMKVHRLVRKDTTWTLVWFLLWISIRTTNGAYLFEWSWIPANFRKCIYNSGLNWRNEGEDPLITIRKPAWFSLARLDHESRLIFFGTIGSFSYIIYPIVMIKLKLAFVWVNRSRCTCKMDHSYGETQSNIVI